MNIMKREIKLMKNSNVISRNEKDSILNLKSTLDVIKSILDTAEEMTREFEHITIKEMQNEPQRENNMGKKNRTSVEFEMLSSNLTYK